MKKKIIKYISRTIRLISGGWLLYLDKKKKKIILYQGFRPQYYFYLFYAFSRRQQIIIDDKNSVFYDPIAGWKKGRVVVILV